MEPSGSIALDQKFRLQMKCLEVICPYQTRSWTHVFVIVKTNALLIDGGRLVLGLFVKIALIANRVLSKTCPEVFIQVL